MEILLTTLLLLLPLITAQSTNCPSESYANAMWGPSGLGLISGTCNMGYSGSISRNCLSGGIWSTCVIGSCVRNQCLAKNEDNVNWPQTSSLLTATGSCLFPYFGSPTRPCDASGNFGAISNGCVLNLCPAGSYANADWLDSQPGLPSGTCSQGYSGTITRNCFTDGTWSTSVIGHCIRNQCGATIADNAQWYVTNSLTQAIGSCVSPYFGTSTRMCDANGVFGAVISPCYRPPNCPAGDYGAMTFPEAQPGQIVVGACMPDAMSLNGGPPSRKCLPNGVWSTAVVNVCMICPPDDNDST